MTEPISEPDYWSKRLKNAHELHHSIFKCSLHDWRAIEEVHRGLLNSYIGYSDSVLDVGCGYGRLLELMPEDWTGSYMGVDLCPDFIEFARENHPSRMFITANILDPVISPDGTEKFDWAVIISFRPMVKRNLGEHVWEEMEYKIRKIANQLLYLEYDLNDWSIE